jgi:hypothetical protein
VQLRGHDSFESIGATMLRGRASHLLDMLPRETLDLRQGLRQYASRRGR